jgi:hypothetical protein
VPRVTKIAPLDRGLKLRENMDFLLSLFHVTKIAPLDRGLKHQCIVAVGAVLMLVTKIAPLDREGWTRFSWLRGGYEVVTKKRNQVAGE